MGVRNGRIFHPGVFWGVRKWRILCFISANSPSGVGGRFFARGVRFFELPGIRKGGKSASNFSRKRNSRAAALASSEWSGVAEAGFTN